MREAEQQYMNAALQEVASSRTASENGSTSSQPDQQVQADFHSAETDQNRILKLNNNHTEENVNFQTPYRAEGTDSIVHSSRAKLTDPRKRLANAFASPISEDDRISTADDFPLASSQLRLRGVQQPLQPVREIVPSALTQPQPAVPASVTGSVQTP